MFRSGYIRNQNNQIAFYRKIQNYYNCMTTYIPLFESIRNLYFSPHSTLSYKELIVYANKPIKSYSGNNIYIYALYILIASVSFLVVSRKLFCLNFPLINKVNNIKILQILFIWYILQRIAFLSNLNLKIEPFF